MVYTDGEIVTDVYIARGAFITIGAGIALVAFAAFDSVIFGTDAVSVTGVWHTALRFFAVAVSLYDITFVTSLALIAAVTGMAMTDDGCA